jgi:hypothetical protein
MSSHDVLDGFEERLLTQLKEVVAERGSMTATPAAPAARPGRRRLVVSLAMATALVVVGVLVAALLPGLGEAPAYAVTRDPDGSIRVYIRDYRDPKGLQRRLEAFGVKAAVDYIPLGKTCREPRGDFVPPEQAPREMVSWGPFGEEDGFYWKLHPEFIGPDQTFVYEVQVGKDAHGDGVQRAMIRLANGPVAPCDPVPVG